MSYLNQLEDYIEEYLKEEDKKRIPFIAIHIPQHKGDLWISYSWFLMTSPPDQPFKLVVRYSTRKDTRKGKRLLQKAEESNLFQDFIQREDSQKVTFLKETNNDKKAIAGLISHIVTTLFPTIQPQEVKVRMTRFDNWFTIEE
jgi:hypothetical protein